MRLLVADQAWPFSTVCGLLLRRRSLRLDGCPRARVGAGEPPASTSAGPSPCPGWCLTSSRRVFGLLPALWRVLRHGRSRVRRSLKAAFMRQAFRNPWPTVQTDVRPVDNFAADCGLG